MYTFTVKLYIYIYMYYVSYVYVCMYIYTHMYIYIYMFTEIFAYVHSTKRQREGGRGIAVIARLLYKDVKRTLAWTSSSPNRISMDFGSKRPQIRGYWNAKTSFWSYFGCSGLCTPLSHRSWTASRSATRQRLRCPEGPGSDINCHGPSSL